MKDNHIDFYEILQVSPNADFDTIERVYRHLAKKLHPDNPVTGDTNRFRILVEAYETLINHEKRAAYDASYEKLGINAFNLSAFEEGQESFSLDQAIRAEILHLLYLKRRRYPGEAGIGFWQIHTALGCPEEHLNFHTWYLKEKGWIRLDEKGRFEISVTGVDEVESGGYFAPLITYKREIRQE